MTRPGGLPSRQLELLQYICPPVVADVVRMGRQGLANIGCGRLLAPNLKWKNAFQGKTVFILGNGPSLHAIDRNVYRDRPVIVMNGFERAEWKGEVDIVAHCIGEPRQSPSWGEHVGKSINETSAASYWLHISAYKQLGEIMAGKSLYYVNPGIEAGLWPSGRRIALESTTLGYATTAQLAIEVGLHMGFTKIILLGFDHDWLASPKYSRHFYSTDKDPEDTLDQHNYLSIIEFSHRMWTIYYKLRNVASGHGATICNMSPGSFLDVFPVIAPYDL